MELEHENQLKKEIQHIFESGANEMRIFNMVKLFIDRRKSLENNENKMGVIPVLWLFFTEGNEDNPHFKVRAYDSWTAYDFAKNHYGPEVEDMMYKIEK